MVQWKLANTKEVSIEFQPDSCNQYVVSSVKRVLSYSSNEEPRTKPMACNIWGASGPPWPTTHKEVSHTRHWDFCFIIYGFWEQCYSPMQGICLQTLFWKVIFLKAYKIIGFHMAFPYTPYLVSSTSYPLTSHSPYFRLHISTHGDIKFFEAGSLYIGLAILQLLM